jgi:membrane-associated protein
VHSIVDFLKALYSTEGITQVIQTGGLAGLAAIVFAETGLLVGFFFPGDSLLVTAGILSSPDAVGGGIFNPVLLALLLSASAIVGDQLNYILGRRTGTVIYQRPDGRLVKRKHFEQARAFYEARGGVAIIVARFVPILRTFVPFVAGVAQMDYRRFVTFNAIGGPLWVITMVTIGYFVGMTPLAKRIHGVIVVVVAVSLIPLAVTAFNQWRSGRKP